MPQGEGRLQDLYRFNAPSDYAFREGKDIFSPSDFIELAQPGHGIANFDGDLVFVSINKYSITEKRTKRSIVISSLETALIPPLTIPLLNGGTVFWLGSRTIGHVLVVEGEKRTDLFAIELEYQRDREGFAGVLRPMSKPSLVGSIPTATAAHFRYASSAKSLVFSDYVYPDGELASVKRLDEAWENRGTTALVYDSMYDRHWSSWVGPKKRSLFVVPLTRDSENAWRLGDRFVNLLKGTGHSCPVGPFGSAEDFDVSDTHIIYTTLDPSLPEALHTRQNIFIVPMDGDSRTPKELTSGSQGATHHPVFNSAGNKVAWLELDEDGYESDRAKIVIYDLNKDVRFTITQFWDRSPNTLAFSRRGDYLYSITGDQAKFKAFLHPVPPTPDQSTSHPALDGIYLTPIALTTEHSVTAPQPLPDGRLLLTQSSFTSSNNIVVVHPPEPIDRSEPSFLPSQGVQQITNFNDDVFKNKHLSRGEEFWFTGAEDRRVHGWILKPGGFEKGSEKQWPVVLLIHGGPQDVWADRWSDHWNPNVFAGQGYVTVLINCTGSTTFGQAFTDAITQDWADRPFVDLLNGWRYILKEYPEIDQERAVAMGASWGGYAVNWIQGHPELQFGFKALVCHAGLLDIAYDAYTTDEPFFFNHDWAGRPWEGSTKETMSLFSPSSFIHKWSIPQLLIHGSKDYRVPETESIAAFHALQQRGIPTRLVVFPDEGHFVANPLSNLKWHYEIFRWFNKFVGRE